METNQTNQKTYTTTYAVAASWAGCTTILCNNIVDIDDELMYTTIGYECDEETEEYPEVYIIHDSPRCTRIQKNNSLSVEYYHHDWYGHPYYKMCGRCYKIK